MPSPEGLRIGIGETKFRADGARISFVAKNENVKKPLPKASNTAIHEAKHAVVAEANGTSVIDATVIPGQGHLGLTRLSKPDAIAAVAPHASGMSGTGHDVRITRLMGHNESSIGHIALKIANDNHHKIHIVASELDRKGSLSGGEIRQIMHKVDAKKNGVSKKEGIIFIKNPDGSVQKIDQELEAGASTAEAIIFQPKPKKEVSGQLPKAA